MCWSLRRCEKLECAAAKPETFSEVVNTEHLESQEEASSVPVWLSDLCVR